VARRLITLAALRSAALARTLFAPRALAQAIARIGFVQADPIRAPARAQDLILRHRAKAYRAGDLERLYPRLAIEEDFFVNYGFLPRATQALLHPRTPRKAWTAAQAEKAAAVLEFVRAHGVAHPREVDAYFQHGKVKNWFGGSSNASTQLLDQMHYRGLLRTASRAGGTRLYAVREAKACALAPPAAMDALVDVIVNAYAPLPHASLSGLVNMLALAAPQWAGERRAALQRALARLAWADVDGVRWLWPAGERLAARAPAHAVRLLAPFDPLVWDRRRFELLWGWAYRFEAYVPAPKRVRGHYALPLLWREAVIGWGNLAVRNGKLDAAFGYVTGAAPREPAFKRALADELGQMEVFLGLG
jgi:uncharacterized protein